MKITLAIELEVFTRDWIYEVDGCDEDGQPNQVRVWHVYAEARSGHRWILNTFTAKNDEDRAWRFVARVNDKIRREGCEALLPEHWISEDPRYGSEAYRKFEAEEIAPIAQALSSGRVHEQDVPGAVAAYF